MSRIYISIELTFIPAAPRKKCIASTYSHSIPFHSILFFSNLCQNLVTI